MHCHARGFFMRKADLVAPSRANVLQELPENKGRKKG